LCAMGPVVHTDRRIRPMRTTLKRLRRNKAPSPSVGSHRWQTSSRRELPLMNNAVFGRESFTTGEYSVRTLGCVHVAQTFSHFRARQAAALPEDLMLPVARWCCMPGSAQLAALTSNPKDWGQDPPCQKHLHHAPVRARDAPASEHLPLARTRLTPRAPRFQDKTA